MELFIFLFLLTIALLLLGLVIVIRNERVKGRDADFAHIVFLITAICTFFLGYTTASEREYKQGQVDALKGDYKYEMKVKTTTDTTYVEKNG